MGWNGSNIGGNSEAPKKSAKVATQNVSLTHGVIALIAVVAIGGGAYFCMSTPDVKPHAHEQSVQEQKSIAEVMPEFAPTIGEAIVDVPKKPLRFWEVDASQTNGFTKMQQRKWEKEHRPPPGYTNNTSRTEAPPSYAIFDHHSENTIAAYLTMTPGDTMVGTPHYGKRFVEDFKASLEHPIIVTQDDTPEQAELKRLMIETKIDLANRMREGEDIGQILEETHEEYQRLAAIKSDFQQELNRFKKDPTTTMQDVEDFLTVANKMLEERGVAPLTLSPISRHMLLRREGVQ